MKKLIIVLLSIFAVASVRAQYDASIEVSWLRQFSIPKDAHVNGGVKSTKAAFSYLFSIGDLMIGPGVGIDFARWDDYLVTFSREITTTAIDPFARIKYDFRSRAINPFISLDCGYSFMLGSNMEMNKKSELYKRDGFYFTPSIGVEFWIPKFCGIYATVGYNYLNQLSNSHFTKGYSIQSTVVKLGITF